ncbi:cupin [Stackebrandtia soli]|uniref:cupin n=1 Tax=Stackebrandtia soli TaxID=1892856 RepID=UPI0039EBA01F
MTGYDIEDRLDWDRFATRYWGRRPVRYRAAVQGPTDMDTVYSAVLAACAPTPDGRIPSIIQFTSGNRRRVDAAPWLPTATDVDFAAYGARITDLLGGEAYALTVNGVHIPSAALWDSQRRFFGELWKRVGLPRTSAITTLFHGNYAYTPVGVHKDRFATFMYVLSGRKRMRMWPKRPWDHDATTITDYREHHDSSISIDADAGDLVYWPSSYHHVGENLGEEPATSINVGFPWEGHRTIYDLTELLSTSYADDLISHATALGTSVPTWDGPWNVPFDQRSARSTLASARRLAEGAIVGSSTRTRRITVALARHTAAGFWPTPRPLPVPTLTGAESVHGTARPVVWSAVGGRTWYSAVGQVASTALPGSELDRLVAALRSDAPARVAGLAPDAETREVLARLVSWRAAILS